MQQECAEFPPVAFIKQVLDKISSTYVFLWETKDDFNRVYLSWKDLSKRYHKNSFRSSLRKLNDEGLLSFEETDEGIRIELVGWDDIEEN